MHRRMRVLIARGGARPICTAGAAWLSVSSAGAARRGCGVRPGHRSLALAHKGAGPHAGSHAGKGSRDTGEGPVAGARINRPQSHDLLHWSGRGGRRRVMC
jgi:hypothetical protein